MADQEVKEKRILHILSHIFGKAVHQGFTSLVFGNWFVTNYIQFYRVPYHVASPFH